VKLVQFDLAAADVSKAIGNRFLQETRGVTALFERVFPGLRTEDVWKVRVECRDKAEDHEWAPALGVQFVDVDCDVTAVLALEREERKRRFLELLCSGLEKVAARYGWPWEPFEEARRKALDLELRNEWTWKKQRWSKGRRLVGRLRCVHEFEAFRAWLVVEGRDGVEVARKQVLETRPDEFAFARFFGDIRWISPGRVALLAKNGSEVGCVEVPRALLEGSAERKPRKEKEPRSRSKRSSPSS